jgi:hypothetical protein
VKDKGLQAALVALAMFRHRHDPVETRKRGKTVCRVDSYQAATRRFLCRRYIREARGHGWRGSIIAAVKRGEHLIE